MAEVSIHRAWQWRELSPEQQREALWVHRNRNDTRRTIRRMIEQHTQSRRVAPALEPLRAMFRELTTEETVVGVADIPGNAIVVTRECYEALRHRRANDSRAAT